ncbi:MAG: hypothetical protein ABIP12_00745 [Terriglobales bacterium]
MRKLVRLGISLAALCLLFACSTPSDAPKGKADKAKDGIPSAPAKAENEFQTGRSAFQKMYVAARTWSPDSQPIRLESSPHTEDPDDGRAAIWKAVFASASKQNIRNFSWSGVASDPENGVQPGSLDYYSAANASTRPFDLNFLKVDSTQAFEVAEKKGGAALRKKDLKLPVKYMLFFDSTKNRLLWRVIYGASQSGAKLSVLVSASSGEFVMVEK